MWARTTRDTPPMTLNHKKGISVKKKQAGTPASVIRAEMNVAVPPIGEQSEARISRSDRG